MNQMQAIAIIGTADRAEHQMLSKQLWANMVQWCTWNLFKGKKVLVNLNSLL